MITNDELFRKLMRFSREVRMKKCQDGKPDGGRGGCGPRPMGPMPGMHSMPGMHPVGPMYGMRPMGPMPGMRPMGPMPGMCQTPPMPEMRPMPPVPPHCGPHGKGPHGPGKHGRGMSRERLLVIISEHPEGVGQKDLAWEADINASSASELIGRLEADGFLTREADENDRRAVLLKLTEAGKQRAEELRAERDGFLTDLFSRLTEEEKETFSALLDKLLG